MAAITWGDTVFIEDPFRGRISISSFDEAVVFFEERELRIGGPANWSGVLRRYGSATSGGQSGVARLLLLKAMQLEGVICT